MPTSKAYCQKHSDKVPTALKAKNKALRKSYDSKLGTLNRCQAAPWRHACPYCIYDQAYAKGFADGAKSVATTTSII